MVRLQSFRKYLTNVIKSKKVLKYLGMTIIILYFYYG